MPVETPHACLCCGQRTLAGEPPGTWLTCSACGWTDIALDSRHAENQLFEARRALGAEASPSPREREAASLIEAIEAAFAEIAPGDRVSLREAYRADYDRDPAPDERGAEWTDGDRRWSEIPDEVLAYFADRTSVFIFGNAASFRYYLPAYLAYDLRHQRQTAIDALLRADDERLALLDEAQREVVRRYLQHHLDFAGPDERIERALLPF